MKAVRFFAVLALLALLALLATPALAGPHLRWNACEGDPGATANQAFACNTNSGTEVLYGSWWVPDSLPTVRSTTIILNLVANTSLMPSWWQFKNSGSCRQTSLGFSLAAPGSSQCADRWLGMAAGGIGAYTDQGAGRARLALIVAVPPGFEVGIGPHTGEMFGFKLLLNHAATVGTGSCAGCTVPVCIAFDQLQFTQSAPNPDVNYAGVFSRDNDWFVTWQGPSNPYPPGGCPLATPVRNETWGSIKTLYR